MQNLLEILTSFQSDVENAGTYWLHFVVFRLRRDISPRRKPHFCGLLESPAVFPKPDQVVYAFSLRSEGKWPGSRRSRSDLARMASIWRCAYITARFLQKRQASPTDTGAAMLVMDIFGVDRRATVCSD